MNIKNIKKVSKNYYYKLKILIFLSFLASLLELFGIASIPFLVSSIINPENSYLQKIFSLFNPEAIKDIDFNLNYFLILICTIFISKNLFLVWIYNFEEKIFYNIKVSNANSIFNYYLFSKIDYFKNKNSSVLIRNLVQENTQAVYYIHSLVTIGRELLILILILLLLFFNSFKVTFIAIFFISLISYFFYFFFKSEFKKRGIEVQNFKSKILKQLNETFGAIKEIKLLQAENKISLSFNNIVSKLENNYRYQQFVSRLTRPFLEILSIIFLILLIYNFYSNNYNTEKLIFDLTLFSICFLRFIPAFNIITRSYSKLKFLQPAIKVIGDELENISNLEIEKLKNKKNYNFEEIKNFNFSSLKFENVEYKYDNKSIFRNISFEINKGDKVVISGPSGRGKTTLCDLLLGLIEQSQGVITINNNANIIRNVSWKNILSYVPQNIFLLDGTIIQNLMFDTSIVNYDKKKISEILKIVCLEAEFANQIDRNIGEMGIKISGGQKQRLAIARAILKKPQILILDEATSGISKQLEEEIFENIKKYLPDITIVMVTHRANKNIKFDKEINL